jgi:adenylylsulfate kinase
MKILIMGLPSSGKTTLAKELYKILPNCDWFNADEIRKQFNDWDFSDEGRIRQAKRMTDLASNSNKEYVICDFIAPTNEIRSLFDADFIIWMNTINESGYEDTNKIFINPLNCNFMIETKDANKWAKSIKEKLCKH